MTALTAKIRWGSPKNVAALANEDAYTEAIDTLNELIHLAVLICGNPTCPEYYVSSAEDDYPSLLHDGAELFERALAEQADAAIASRDQRLDVVDADAADAHQRQRHLRGPLPGHQRVDMRVEALLAQIQPHGAAIGMAERHMACAGVVLHGCGHGPPW